jgi:competence protein ComEA
MMTLRRTNTACLSLLLCLSLGVPAFCSQNESAERININTASAAELESLPDIGPVLAKRIVEHRGKHGPFKRAQDVVVVRGLSAKLYRRIAHLIRT